MTYLSSDRILFYQKNPVVFCHDFLDVSLWWKQEEILNSLVDGQWVSVPSCHESGKTFVAACAVIWFIMTHPYSKVVTTAPTDRQVRIALWGDINRLHSILRKKVDYAGVIFQKEWRIAPSWFAIGFSTDDPNAFQGQHAAEGHILGIFDEATGISKQIFEQAVGVFMGPDSKGLLLGNPTAPNNYFHWCCEGKISGHKVIKISAFDCPNIIPDGKGWYKNREPLPYRYLVEMSFVEKIIRDYGIESPQVRARVYGEFPDSAQDQLISNEMLAAALQKGVYLRRMVEMARKGEEIIPSDQIANRRRRR